MIALFEDLTAKLLPTIPSERMRRKARLAQLKHTGMRCVGRHIVFGTLGKHVLSEERTEECYAGERFGASSDRGYLSRLEFRF